MRFTRKKNEKSVLNRCSHLQPGEDPHDRRLQRIVLVHEGHETVVLAAVRQPHGDLPPLVELVPAVVAVVSRRAVLEQSHGRLGGYNVKGVPEARQKQNGTARTRKRERYARRANISTPGRSVVGTNTVTLNWEKTSHGVCTTWVFLFHLKLTRKELIPLSCENVEFLKFICSTTCYSSVFLVF